MPMMVLMLVNCVGTHCPLPVVFCLCHRHKCAPLLLAAIAQERENHNFTTQFVLVD